MIKTLALFTFFAITALTNVTTSITMQLAVFIAAFVLAVIYFLDLLGHPVTR